MTANKKILQGIEKWAKVMLKTGALKRMQDYNTDGWYDEDEVVCSIRGYVKTEGVDLWGGDTFCGMPVRIYGAFIVFLGISGFFVVVPKEGWELVNRLALTVLVVFGVQKMFFTK